VSRALILCLEQFSGILSEVLLKLNKGLYKRIGPVNMNMIWKVEPFAGEM